MKVVYYSPLPPSRSGVADYSALLLPALEQRIDVEIARPGSLPPHAEGGRRPVPRRQRPGGSRLDRRSAAAPPGRRRPPRARPPSPRGGNHARPRRRCRVPRGNGARPRPRRPPARLRRARQPHSAALGDEAAGLPARGRDPQARTEPRRPLALRGGGCAGGGLRGPDRTHPASRLGPRRRDGHGAEPHRLLRPPQREQADPAALRGLRAPAGATSRRAVCSSSVEPRDGSPISRCPTG